MRVSLDTFKTRTCAINHESNSSRQDGHGTNSFALAAAQNDNTYIYIYIPSREIHVFSEQRRDYVLAKKCIKQKTNTLQLTEFSEKWERSLK